MTAAIRRVAAERLRRRRTASLALAVFAGVTAAGPMALWVVGREAATSVDRFIESADAAAATVIVCPAGAGEALAQECFTDPGAGEVEVVRSVPHVEQAAQLSFTPVVGGTSTDEAEWRPLGMISLGEGAIRATPLGDPVVVAGRLAAADAADELMVTESAARGLGLAPGDELLLRSEHPEAPANPPIVATVTGVIRSPADLLPLTLESGGGPPLFARGGWIEAHADELPSFDALSVWLDDDDIAGFVERLQPLLPDQAIRTEETFPPGDRQNLEHATLLESRAILATAAVAALAAAFFVGQAVSRQARREAEDAPTLVALGMTRRQLASAALLRWLPVAVGATVLALVVVLAASTLGPIGVARRGPWERSMHADAAVLLTGGLAVLALVLVVAAAARPRRAAGVQTAASSAVPFLGSPGLRSGLSLARRSLGRDGAVPLVSAVVATALAMALVITATGGAASLRLVTDDPARFGVPWDALLSGDSEGAGEVLARLPGVQGATWIAGTDLSVGDDPVVWTQAHIPVDGIEQTRSVITEGRAPEADDEIALGSLTQGRAGVDIGDEVLVGENALPYRVVGLTMVTDGYEPNVGHGALMSPEGLLRAEPSAAEFPELAVDVVDGPGRDAALEALRAAFPGTQIPFPVPSSLANAERIAGLPLFLGLAAAAVAAVTLTHALITSVRRNGRELAVCRVLGFTGVQVRSAVATQATVLGVAAALIGVPLGIVGARWGWRVISASFGVAVGPVVPLWIVAVSACSAVVVANLVAGPSARAAARLRPAEALRTE